MEFICEESHALDQLGQKVNPLLETRFGRFRQLCFDFASCPFNFRKYL